MTRRRRETKIVDGITLYKCSKCHEFLLESRFSKKTSTTLRSSCNKCDNARKKAQKEFVAINGRDTRYSFVNIPIELVESLKHRHSEHISNSEKGFGNEFTEFKRVPRGSFEDVVGVRRDTLFGVMSGKRLKCQEQTFEKLCIAASREDLFHLIYE